MTPEELVKLNWEELFALANDGDKVLVCTWQEGPGDLIQRVNQNLPAKQAFEFEEEDEGLSVKHAHGKFSISWREWENIEHQALELLSRLNRLLTPDYEIFSFRCREGTDGGAFLCRPKKWWTGFYKKFPNDFQRIFSEL